jgi:hypothetical protein
MSHPLHYTTRQPGFQHQKPARKHKKKRHLKSAPKNDKIRESSKEQGCIK